MSDYPPSIVPVNHVAPVPRRIRAALGGETVLDTIRARYVWEHAHYPQYYIPLADVREGLLVAEGNSQATTRGTVELHGLRLGDLSRPGTAKLLVDARVEGLSGTVRFDWDALDAWYEEDERVFVHPRDPYTRIDVLRSTRHVKVELGGAVLAESSSPVILFETGLPPRYYLNRTEVDVGQLVPSDTVTACPYKGRTTGYWSLRAGERSDADIAWCYDFPTQQVAPIAGLTAFYNEKVDIFLDGEKLERPRTAFSAGS